MYEEIILSSYEMLNRNDIFLYIYHMHKNWKFDRHFHAQ